MDYLNKKSMYVSYIFTHCNYGVRNINYIVFFVPTCHRKYDMQVETF